MITLFHGDDLEASRTKFNEWKSKHADTEIRIFDGRTLDADILTRALESSSLFGAGHVVVIDNLISKQGKKTKVLSQLCSLLAAAASTIDIALWEEKEITASTVQLLGKTVTVVLCKTPVIIFRFLDALRPGNAKQALLLLNELGKEQVPEVTLSLVVRRVRLLIQVNDHVTPLDMQSWQISRLTKQAEFFTMKQLRMIEQKLLDIEYSIKTGTSPFHLTDQIAQLLISL